MTFLAVFCLVSCGGGGSGSGGGGGGGGGGKAATLSIMADGAATAGKPASLSDAIGSGPAAGLTAADPTNGVNGFRVSYDLGLLGSSSTSNVRIQVEGNSVVVRTPDGSVFFTAKDMTLFDNGFVGKVLEEESAKLTQANTGLAGISGNMKGIEAVMLGGKSVGLEYTNFGFWEGRATAQGKYNGVAFDTTISSYSPFILEAANADKKAPASTEAFSGTVLANAWDRKDDLNSKSVSLVGQASLNIAPGASNLTFTFDNFYTLSTDLNVSGTGKVSNAANSFTVSDSSKNTTGITLNSGAYQSGTSLTGQFYGGAASPAATEAVGTFNYKDTVNTTGVRGAWGVKAQ